MEAGRLGHAKQLQAGGLAGRQAEPLPLLTAGLDAAVQRAGRLPLALLAVAGAVAQVAAAGAHPVCSGAAAAVRGTQRQQLGEQGVRTVPRRNISKHSSGRNATRCHSMRILTTLPAQRQLTLVGGGLLHMLPVAGIQAVAAQHTLHPGQRHSAR